jgi:spermidine synthase/tetratricopeptide (TPR) repeat protein/MFS family permease
MGGLALGAFYWGKYTDKVLNQLGLYGFLELGIGFYCLAYPFMIDVVGKLFINIASAFDITSQREVLLSLKFLLSFITLIAPTILMGGTLPILTKFLSKSISDSGKDVATLYYVNSFGAVIGTGLAGFFLIRLQGLDNTVWIAASVNILIGLLAILLSKCNRPGVQPEKSSKVKEVVQNQVFSDTAIRIAIFTAFASGFLAMLYELAWTRLLAKILGSTTYSFTVMLIAFISGIALGSFIVSLIIKRVKNFVAFLAICQYGTAVSMILTLPLYERLPYYLLKVSAMIPNQPENFPTFLGLEFLFCFLIMLVPTVFSGMSLPVASRIANRDLRVLGKSVGGIFSINTMGSVAGVLITGLVLIPLLGVKLTVELGVLLNGLLGLFVFYKAGLSPQLKMGFTLFFVLIAVGYRILFPSWNENFLISGVFRTLYTQDVPLYREFIEQQNEGQKILWHKEGVDADVAVRESAFGDSIQKTLVINGKADASTVADLQTQILLGQIPLMLYPDSGDALVIGLGSGITCGSVLRHPVKSLDVVEIASEVVECNSFFTKENNNFMADARVRIFIDDAITQLKTTLKKYDYIISEPSNPWIAGIGNLYSLEFFNECKERLNANGVLTQWFHTYYVNNDIFRLVLGTINKVFPYVSIWKVSDADLIILGSVTPLSIDFEAMESKMKNPKIAQDLGRIKIYDVPSLLSTQIVSARNNPYSFIKNNFNTAKKPLLEFWAPVALFTHETVTVLDSLDERFSFQDKNLWLSEYMNQRPLSFENYMNMALYRSTSHIGDLAIAYTALRKCLEIEPNNREALSLITKIANDLGLPDVYTRKSKKDELRLMYELNPEDNSAIFGYLNALVEYYRIDNSIVNPQQMDDAVELMKKAIKSTQGQVERYHYILAMVLTGAGRYDEAAEAFKALLQFQNLNRTGSALIRKSELIYNIAESYYNAGNILEAEKYYERLKSIDDGNANYLVMQRKIAMKKSGVK